MQEYYFLRIRKGYASSVIEDLQKMKAIELVEPTEVAVPEWQQKETLARLQKMEQHPETNIGWDTALEKLGSLTK